MLFDQLAIVYVPSTDCRERWQRSPNNRHGERDRESLRWLEATADNGNTGLILVSAVDIL